MTKADACLITNSGIAVTDLALEGGEPRVRDLRLAEALGFSNRHDIRTLIRRHAATLATFGEVVSRQDEKLPRGGRPGRSFLLNKRQALYITAKSDTERAALVTVQMVEVFDAVTRGAAPAPVKVREHVRSLPRPAAMKDGRGCIVLNGAAVFFDTTRRPAVGQPALVMWRTGRVSIETMLEQYPEVPQAAVPGPAFIWVLEPGKKLGTYHCRQKVTLLGIVTTETGRPASVRIAR